MIGLTRISISLVCTSLVEAYTPMDSSSRLANISGVDSLDGTTWSLIARWLAKLLLKSETHATNKCAMTFPRHSWQTQNMFSRSSAYVICGANYWGRFWFGYRPRPEYSKRTAYSVAKSSCKPRNEIQRTKCDTRHLWQCRALLMQVERFTYRLWTACINHTLLRHINLFKTQYSIKIFGTWLAAERKNGPTSPSVS